LLQNSLDIFILFSRKFVLWYLLLKNAVDSPGKIKKFKHMLTG